eukprot:364558-Chlamydomonas_euryale.AAC.16
MTKKRRVTCSGTSKGKISPEWARCWAPMSASQGESVNPSDMPSLLTLKVLISAGQAPRTDR